MTVSFAVFDVENTYDFVNVYDGADANAPLLAALTGTALPADVTSTTAQVYVEFVTDSTVTAEGFEASWAGNPIGTTTGCTGTTTLTGATGTFDDGSGVGVDYDNSAQCGWLIDTDATLYGSVTLSFSSFDVENTYDFVNVYDGADANAPLLVALTGTTLPADVTSTTNQLFVELVTDSIVTAEGFEASWVANPIVLPPTCSGNGTFTTATGTFEDGSGAADYDNSLQCGWLIDVDASLYGSVTLSFSSFALENTYDFVNVYDGADTNAPLLVSLTGTGLPANVTSTTNQLFVELVTDSSVTADGFGAGWVANPIVIPPTCSGNSTLTTATGSFDDGSGAGDYDNSLQCGWLIEVDASLYGSVTLSFSAFDLENTYDFVNVYDGADANAPLIVSLTGTSLPASVTSTGNKLFVEFVTDFIVTADGFEAGWTSNPLATACSGTTVVTAASGSFTDGPGNYANNTTCGWLIAAPGTEAVTLSFSSFVTESNYDFVTVYDGVDSSAPVLLALSGSNIDTNVTLVATLGPLFVQFTSDGSVRADGFVANYTTYGATDECSGDLVLTDPVGALSDGAGNYDNNALCSWTIQVEDAAGIELTFSSVQTEQNYDYLDVFDGADDYASLIASYDGTFYPATLSSTGAQMFVELDTDGSVTAPGFTATYEAVYVDCSGSRTLTALSGAFGDGSGLDGNYTNNQTCSWSVDAPSGATIQLTAVYWELEQGYDTIAVHDGASAAASVLTTWTGSGANDTWVTTGNQAFVEFSSDFSITDRGFWVEYTVIP